MNKEEALAEARSTSWKSGVSTALITGLFGTGKGGGVESVAVGRKAAGLTLRDLGALARKQGVADVLRSSSFRKMLGETLVHAGGEATEEGIDQLAQAFLHQKPDTNLAEAWNQAVEAMKVGGALGASTHTASSAIERGPATAHTGVASNGWRALPANLGDSFRAAASMRGAMASSPAASSAMIPGGGSPHDLAARFAKEWSMAAPSAAAPGAMRNASGRPARPAPLHAEHSLSTGGIVGGVGSVYAAPSTPSTPRVASPAAPAAQGDDAGQVAEPSTANITVPPMEEAQGVVSPAPVLSPQASAAGDTPAPNGSEANKRLTKEQQTAVRVLGNIRDDLSRMRERLARSDLKPELRESLEKSERHYAAKEAEFAAKVEQPILAHPQAVEEMPAFAGAAIGGATEAMPTAMESGRFVDNPPLPPNATSDQTKGHSILSESNHTPTPEPLESIHRSADPGLPDVTQHGKSQSIDLTSHIIPEADELLNNPKSIWGLTAEDISQTFENAGYKTTIRQSNKGSRKARIVVITHHSIVTQIQVHAGGGRHSGKYYKISTSTRGIIKIIDPSTYKPTQGETSTIINF